ncbi:MAG: S1 RNA-binding domain-containing protein, partial [Oscillospiraceae bacterium]|nr:S1 RNA-binding domain-containing protein [Oscillospiraceae bacterium]
MEYIQESNMELSTGLTIAFMQKAMEEGHILCHRALVYEKGIGLHFNLGGFRAVMPTEEVTFSPDGSDVKEAAVVTRINKNVCFMITDIQEDKTGTVIYISRKKAQQQAYENYISKLVPGDIIPCCITHVDSFGVFCDIGCGISALLPIDFISVSRITSPSDRFTDNQNIFACIKNIGDDGRIVLTHKELLGTWLENAKLFKPLTTTV